jgi:hypothetical protein
MRKIKGSEDNDVSRWPLGLVAVVCFGPLTLVLLLGVLALPLWFGMLVAFLAEPARHAHESIWTVVWPIAYVISGLIGLAGLIRVLALPRRERPKSHRILTIGMVGVGLIALAIFDLSIVIGTVSDFPEDMPVAALLVYVVLPFTGAVWLLCKLWRVLLAARGQHS